MKYKQLLFLIILLTYQPSLCKGQLEHKNNLFDDLLLNKNNESVRKIFIYTSLGVLEVLSIGIGYQISKNAAMSIKGSGTWIGSSTFNIPASGMGLGFKLSYYKTILFFNNFSFEYISYLSTTLDWDNLSNIPLFKGSYFDFNLGKETINECGFNFFGAIGFYSSATKKSHVVYSPSLKFGLNYNIY